MGLVGAGTNNARLAQMLRQLAVYYQKDANALFMVRQAQGFVHLGKGTLTLNPFQGKRIFILQTRCNFQILLTDIYFTQSIDYLFWTFICEVAYKV